MEIDFKFDRRYTRHYIAGRCKSARATIILGVCPTRWDEYIDKVMIPELLYTIHHETLHAVLRETGIIRELLRELLDWRAELPLIALNPKHQAKVLKLIKSEERFLHICEKLLEGEG